MMDLVNPKDTEKFLTPSRGNRIVFADLQIHSKFSRATSRDLSFENLEKYARMKGIDILGCGDFQHPKQREEIAKKLREDDKGILWTQSGFPFLWQTEISLMFKHLGKRRALHLLVFAPCGMVADEIIKYLSGKGRLDYDGRPIFGMTGREFVLDLKAIDERIVIVPAHCMTPWFGIFGSKSGFDSLEECFVEQTSKIYAVESGMSADPGMLWRFREKVNVVSFSDAHGFWPWRIGREATVFDISELSYDAIMKAVRTGVGLRGTIETPPSYGKYHWDGHRNCNFSCSPSESRKLNGICPKCGKPLTLGVDYRVEEIAKEKDGYSGERAKPYYLLLPLHELIALRFGVGMNTKKSWGVYDDLIAKFETEFNVLLSVGREDFFKEKIDEELVKLILFNREGRLKVKPGFDGEYGQVQMPKNESQKSLV